MKGVVHIYLHLLQYHLYLFFIYLFHSLFNYDYVKYLVCFLFLYKVKDVFGVTPH